MSETTAGLISIRLELDILVQSPEAIRANIHNIQDFIGWLVIQIGQSSPPDTSLIFSAWKELQNSSHLDIMLENQDLEEQLLGSWGRLSSWYADLSSWYADSDGWEICSFSIVSPHPPSPTKFIWVGFYKALCWTGCETPEAKWQCVANVALHWNLE